MRAVSRPWRFRLNGRAQLLADFSILCGRSFESNRFARLNSCKRWTTADTAGGEGSATFKASPISRLIRGTTGTSATPGGVSEKTTRGTIEIPRPSRTIFTSVPRENKVFELVWRTAKPADRLENGCLLIRVAGVNQRQPVVALDQEGVCQPHRDDVHTFDYPPHSQ